MNIILGSGSPRRKSILEEIFGEVQIIFPSVDESLIKDESADVYAERISNLKMDAVVDGSGGRECCVITSDTIVAIDGKILGKPESRDEAVSMLRLLSGKEHYVLTGICITVLNGKETLRFYDCEKTSVRFKLLSDEVIRKYLDMVNYSDKAGSYAIQEHGDILVESVQGSMTNVIGFPLRLFFRMINNSGAAGILFK
ncbi:MAG TPA: Maf family protein [Spirochaetota bacterium]|nr:Maf family protein [Spirochaetota bacterium]HPS85346.1 Maf family protein [Spirochaetota bacterium]